VESLLLQLDSKIEETRKQRRLNTAGVSERVSKKLEQHDLKVKQIIERKG
jgi:hypothetical protein